MKPLDYIFSVLFAVSIFWISYFTNQNAFVANFVTYCIAFVSFLFLYKRSSIIGYKKLLFITISLHLIGLFSVPLLSPDWSRFLWDGELLTRGINPFASLPTELITQPNFNSSHYLTELYSKITPLSAEHYSCYPTINQLYFFFGAVFSDNILVNLIVLRLLMLATLAMGFVYALRLLRLLKLSENTIWLFALNPFVILELTNNLHFEGVVFSFLVMAIFYIYKSKLLKASLFWSLAVGVKLTPLLLLPFLYRYLGFRKSVRFYLLTLSIVVSVLLVLIWPIYFQNFSKSLGLYFSNFEFNSSIFTIIKSIFYDDFGWETVKVIGPWLSRISLLIIVVYSLVYRVRSKNDLIVAMLFGFTTYLLFSSTVHPWYVCIPLGLSIFTPYRSFVVWSFTVMLSYSFYDLGSSTITNVLTLLEYLSFLICIVYELVNTKNRKFTF